jgi:hypothetical protein
MRPKYDERVYDESDVLLRKDVRDGDEKHILIIRKDGESRSDSAVDEVNELVLRTLREQPHLTRSVIVKAIFQQHPGLYERVRAEETTNCKSGETLADVAKQSDDVQAEVKKRVESVMSKESRLTYTQAMQFVFKQDPALYDKWNRESYA